MSTPTLLMTFHRALRVALGVALFAITALAPRPAAAQKCSAGQGQAYIDAGHYRDAAREFSCVIAAQPTEVEGYRGRIEAELMLGQFSDAVRDYARFTAYVLRVHPDGASLIYAGYTARLNADPASIPALTGASFARWYFFDYPAAIHILLDLVAVAPNDLYGNLFLGSTRMLHHVNTAQGMAGLEFAIAVAPQSPDVRYVVADAYTYGTPADPQRAFDEATLALNWGLDTPRLRAILAVSYMAFGDQAAAGAELQKHIQLVTTQLVTSTPLSGSSLLVLPLVPGRSYDIPLPVTAGQSLSVLTSSHDFYDTVLVLLAPDGTPVLGSDDYKSYFAGFEWVAPQTGTYHIWVTSFEGINTGDLSVIWK